MNRTSLIVAALGAALLLQGCVASFAVLAAKAETERLEKLRAWEKDIAAMDCTALAAESKTLDEAKEDLVDYDQRRDKLDEALEDKTCPDPAA